MVSPPADTPEQIAERKADMAICKRAHHEMTLRYPVLTTGNAQEAIDWQNARIEELRNKRKRTLRTK